MEVRKFEMGMLDGGTGDSVVAEIHGKGSVEFSMKPRTMDSMMSLRREVAEKLTEVKADESNAKAIAGVFAVALIVLQRTIELPDGAELSDDQAAMLLSASGGYTGDLVQVLARRNGVSDIIGVAGSDLKDDDHLPT